MNRWLDKKVAVYVICGFLIGLIAVIGLRFITYKSDNVHYHANFALYINGQRDEFKSFTFYEEVQACVSNEDDDPKHLTHMHNEQNDLVHVHAPSVTWGQFFANLGYSLGNDSIGTDKGVFVASDSEPLTFILNGERVDAIANRVIGSEDKLLINYGKDSQETLDERYGQISGSATEFNGKYDPGGCSGNESLTFTERLKKSIL